MKYFVCLVVSLSLIACSTKTGKEEKDLATQSFIDCDFYSAVEKSELAIRHAGENVEVSVPALLILAKSSDILEENVAATSAYENIVRLAPGIRSVSEARNIANKFVQQLSTSAPKKVKNCPALQM